MRTQGVFSTFLILTVVEHATLKKRLIVNWLAPKKGAFFSLIYFFKSFCIYYIPHNYVVPQAICHMPFCKLIPPFTLTGLCAVIGGFRSLAFVNFFAFSLCLFQLLFWLKAMKNAIVNGSKREVIRLFTTYKNKEQVDFVHVPVWPLDYSFYEWIIESKNQLIFPFMNLLVHQWQERLTCFDCNLSEIHLEWLRLICGPEKIIENHHQ